MSQPHRLVCVPQSGHSAQPIQPLCHSHMGDHGCVCTPPPHTARTLSHTECSPGPGSCPVPTAMCVTPSWWEPPQGTQSHLVVLGTRRAHDPPSPAPAPKLGGLHSRGWGCCPELKVLGPKSCLQAEVAQPAWVTGSLSPASPWLQARAQPATGVSGRG